MRKTLTTILAVWMAMAQVVSGEEFYRLEVGSSSVPTALGQPIVVKGFTVEGRGEFSARQASADGRLFVERHDREVMSAISASNLPSFGRAMISECGPDCRGMRPATSCCSHRLATVAVTPTYCGMDCRGMGIRPNVVNCAPNCTGMAFRGVCCGNCSGLRGSPLPSGGYYCNCVSHIAYCRANGLNWQSTPCCCGR